MKGIYIILLVIVIASSISGCVGNKQTGISTKIQTTPQTSASPAVTVSPTPTPSNNVDDQFGTEADIASMDSLVNDMNLDISLSDSI